ncbi:ATP-dependent DNA helicase PIF1-like [Cotesia glomerata]|uniref:ATP-dependent DNA helicase PIF1-like n=1 Tax=Cotesia glomerata TaxID=32391 RepID=UPI001D009A73|nr:ATP-dependent DNA helicase PIF1-like [Cotesia glomerata]
MTMIIMMIHRKRHQTVMLPKLYVSGEGGTGKSFLINVIKRWIREELNRETVVTAPTGIAAFNFNGLTIHRVFQLPVEHGFTPSYTQLSDNVLKALRDQLQNTTLFNIDEISMVSNITLIYIHLRLVEFFDVDDWFGGKHVVVFGDLLQLPPVHENPSYVTLSSQDAEKYVGSLCSVNLWTDLFCYEELRINMRQKTDNIYGQLLSRVRVASMTNEDIKLLEQRKITIDPSFSYNEKLHEICNYIDKLPSDSVCIVPTCKQCDLINSVMTSKISSEEIVLTARDHLDCNKSLIKKVSNTLNKIEDNASQSAGLAKTITIKIGAKVMLRRNIDVTLGLVNGTIGTVKSVSKSIDGSEIQAINIDFSADTEYAIEKIKVKFQLFESAFVVREQFPLCLSYAVTIHKSQG